MKEKAKAPVDPQLDGGPDLDTTHLDRPSDLSSKGNGLVGSTKGEHGPLDTSTDLEYLDTPTSDDPFVPGTGDIRDVELHQKEEKPSKKKKNLPDPTYEANQGNAPQETGGSTDPNNSLSESDSGLKNR